MTTTAARVNCLACRADLDHCHGVVAVDADGHTECLTDPACDGAAVRHEWVIPADELDDQQHAAA